jgi:hypothetical protein
MYVLPLKLRGTINTCQQAIDPSLYKIGLRLCGWLIGVPSIKRLVNLPSTWPPPLRFAIHWWKLGYWSWNIGDSAKKLAAHPRFLLWVSGFPPASGAEGNQITSGGRGGFSWDCYSIGTTCKLDRFMPVLVLFRRGLMTPPNLGRNLHWPSH